MNQFGKRRNFSGAMVFNFQCERIGLSRQTATRIGESTQDTRGKRVMKNNQAKPGISWSRAWPMVTLTFAGLLLGGLAIDSDRANAQEAKTKTKLPFEDRKSTPRGKSLPVAESLTKGKKIEAAALTKLIDQEVRKRLAAEKTQAAGQCSDEEFIRRVHLDIIGVVPTAAKVTEFLSSKDANKRAKLVDDLLADPRFGRYLAEMWAINMVPRESNNRLLKQKPLEDWFANHFNKGMPLDKIVYELITTTGEIDKNPAGTYFVANPTVDKITDNVAKMFLGVQLQWCSMP